MSIVFRYLWKTLCQTLSELFSQKDSDQSGTITFPEFQGVFKVRKASKQRYDLRHSYSCHYQYVQDWGALFVHVDQNKSGSIDARELQTGLRQFGYNLSQHLVENLIRRYGTYSTPPS